MPIALPVARDEITAELDYERGRLVYEGVNGKEVRRSILPGGVRVITERRFPRILGGGRLPG